MKKVLSFANYKAFLTAAVLSLFLAVCMAVSAQAGAVIKKPTYQSKNASVHYSGSTTYYNIGLQKWKKIKSGLIYTYKAKKDTRYYRPLYYLTSSWLSNNGQNLTIHLGTTRSKSVSSVVQSTLGVSKPNVSLATSVSTSYSSTVSSSYTTDYTFVMKNYSKLYYYRPSFFGYILRFAVAKSNRLTKRTYIIYSYTFDNSAGLYLKLAYR